MSDLETFQQAVIVCCERLRAGGKILVCGNGGSAAQAAHFAAELVVRYRKDRRAYPCISLTEPAILTACANDFGYESVFARQVEAYGAPGDVLIALSTSGRSTNVLQAILAAQERKLYVIEPPRPKHMDTAGRQEVHLHWLHDLADHIEHNLT